MGSVNWVLFWESTQTKDLETAWQRTSLIPPFSSPVIEGTQFLIQTTASKLAIARYLFSGRVAKLVSSSVGEFLLQPQRLWLNRTILCVFEETDPCPLLIQPASRLNDLSITIWRAT